MGPSPAADHADAHLAQQIAASVADDMNRRDEFQAQVRQVHENVVEMVKQQSKAEKEATARQAEWDADREKAMDAAVELAKYEAARRRDAEEKKRAEEEFDRTVKAVQAEIDARQRLPTSAAELEDANQAAGSSTIVTGDIKTTIHADPFDNPEVEKAMQAYAEIQKKQKEIEDEREKMRSEMDRVVEYLKDQPNPREALTQHVEPPVAQADPELLRMLRESKKEVLKRQVEDLDRVGQAMQRAIDDKLVDGAALDELESLKSRADTADPTDRDAVGRILSDLVAFGMKHDSSAFTGDVAERIARREAAATADDLDPDEAARRRAAAEDGNAEYKAQATAREPMVKLSELQEQIKVARRSGFGVDAEVDAQLVSLEAAAAAADPMDEKTILRLMADLIGLTSAASDELSRGTGGAAQTTSGTAGGGGANDADEKRAAAAVEHAALQQSINDALDVTVHGQRVRDTDMPLRSSLYEFQKRAALLDECDLSGVRQLMAELIMVTSDPTAADAPASTAAPTSAAPGSEFTAIHDSLIAQAQASFEAATSAAAPRTAGPTPAEGVEVLAQPYAEHVKARSLAEVDAPLVPRAAAAGDAAVAAQRTVVEVPCGSLAGVVLEMFIAHARLENHAVLEVGGRGGAGDAKPGKKKAASLTRDADTVTVTHVATNTVIARGPALTACKVLAVFYREAAGFMYPTAAPLLFPSVDAAYEVVRPLYGLANAVLNYRVEPAAGEDSGAGSALTRALSIFHGNQSDPRTAELHELLSEYQRVLRAVDKEYFKTDKGTALVSQVPVLPDVVLFASVAALGACGVIPADLACHSVAYAYNEAQASPAHAGLALHSAVRPHVSIHAPVREWLETSMHKKTRAKLAGF